MYDKITRGILYTIYQAGKRKGLHEYKRTFKLQVWFQSHNKVKCWFAKDGFCLVVKLHQVGFATMLVELQHTRSANKGPGLYSFFSHCLGLLINLDKLIRG